jgi:hypothetical protein
MNEDRPISERLGLHVNQDVIAKGIKGVIQGFMVEDGVPVRVMVGHYPKDMPPEIVPAGNHLRVLIHYDPKDVQHV